MVVPLVPRGGSVDGRKLGDGVNVAVTCLVDCRDGGWRAMLDVLGTACGETAMLLVLALVEPNDCATAWPSGACW